MFLPTYSSVLNPIEKVWNVVKQEWRQTQHLHALKEFLDMEDCTRYSLDRLRAIIGKDKMLKKVDSLSENVLRAIARSHMASMARSIRGVIV